MPAPVRPAPIVRLQRAGMRVRPAVVASAHAAAEAVTPRRRHHGQHRRARQHSRYGATTTPQ